MNGDARWYEFTPGGVLMILLTGSVGSAAVGVFLALLRVLP